MNEHNHYSNGKCDRFCPAHPLYKDAIRSEELAEARQISQLTVDELLAQMTPEQTNALRASVIGANDEPTERPVEGEDWDDEEPFGDPPQVSSAVTTWLHQFEQDAFKRGLRRGNESANAALARKRNRITELNRRVAELRKKEREAYNRGVADGQGMRHAKDAEKIAALNERVAQLEKLLQRNENTASERDEYVARLTVIAELCNRPVNDPIGERVADLDVFAQRMRRFGQEFISRNEPDGISGDQLVDALVQYVTGRKPTDVPAR